MKIVEFFAKYEEDGQMMEQIIEASKDENTLYEFLKSHGVEVVSASERKKELSDEELSDVAGGGISTPECLSYCQTLQDLDAPEVAVRACRFTCAYTP